jgi:hypothetical protein
MKMTGTVMKLLAKTMRYALPIVALLLVSQPTLACSPVPGSKRTTVFERTQAARLVFEGTVIAVNDGNVTVKIKQYIKGHGAKEVSIQGFNTHSCSDFLGVGDSRIFYAEYIGKSLLLKAVYDGSFGSTNSIDSLNIREATAATYTANVNKQLNINIPKAQWESRDGILDIWVNLNYIGLKDGIHTWQLKNYGEQ